MFNEAFWFFYMVEVVTRIATISVIIVAAIIIIGGIFSMVWLCEENDPNIIKRFWKICGPILVAAIVIAMFTPPKEALYAGAGQYAIEATETDQTLLKLKELVDQKIASEVEKGRIEASDVEE